MSDDLMFDSFEPEVEEVEELPESDMEQRDVVSKRVFWAFASLSIVMLGLIIFEIVELSGGF